MACHLGGSKGFSEGAHVKFLWSTRLGHLFKQLYGSAAVDFFLAKTYDDLLYFAILESHLGDLDIQLEDVCLIDADGINPGISVSLLRAEAAAKRRLQVACHFEIMAVELVADPVRCIAPGVGERFTG